MHKLCAFELCFKFSIPVFSNLDCHALNKMFQIRRDDATLFDQPVEISGDDDAIQKAKDLIDEIQNPTFSTPAKTPGQASSCF